jgi:tetratricopeptide (TPR) repeat protein
MDLIRALLLKLEAEATDRGFSFEEGEAETLKRTLDEVRYNLQQAEQMGLVEVGSKPLNGEWIILRLTPKGPDFLERGQNTEQNHLASVKLPAAMPAWRSQSRAEILFWRSSDPGNAGWQRDLSVSYNKIGDVQVAQGDLKAALKSYSDDLAIAERLANSDPSNAGWQRDLSVSYAKLADAYRKSNETAKARDVLAAGRAIIGKLVEQYPDQAQWKQDLTWFDARIADQGKTSPKKKPARW